MGEYLHNAPATISLKSAGYGSYALINVNKYGSDHEAYDWPILKVIQSYGKKSQTSSEKFFLSHFEIIVALPWRVSKDDNTPVWVYNGKSDQKYKAKVFLIKKLKSHGREEIERICTLFAHVSSSLPVFVKHIEKTV